MLLSVQNPYTFSPSSHPSFSAGLSKDKFRPINVGKGFTSPLLDYTKSLETNLQILKLKYPFKQESQLRSLLEELQNDLTTVINIIEEEVIEIDKLHLTQPLEVEQEKGKGEEVGQSPPGVVEKKAEVSEQEDKEKKEMVSENKLLKRSYLKLYYKFEEMKKELSLKEEQLHTMEIKVQKLKTANQLLLEERMNEEGEEEMSNMYIC